MNKKKVIFVTEKLIMGGVEKSLLEWIKILAPYMEITVAVMHLGGELETEIGKGTRSRLHSGTLTLHAAEKRGLSGIFPGLFYMAFPPAKNLLWRFPYLKKHPYLLPFAWGQRLCGYLREGPVLGSVKEIVKTGRKRKEILREYGIFGEKRR